MNRKILGVVFIAVVGVAAVYFGSRFFGERSAVAQSPGAGQRAIPIQIATAEKKKAPVLLDALGTVTPMASVAIRSDRAARRHRPDPSSGAGTTR